MSMIHIEAKIRHTADYEELWGKLPKSGISIGARGTDYLLTFNGQISIGKQIIETLISEGHCSVNFIVGY